MTSDPRPQSSGNRTRYRLRGRTGLVFENHPSLASFIMILSIVRSSVVLCTSRAPVELATKVLTVVR